MISLRQKLIQELKTIPGLEEKLYPERSDGFSALLYKGKDFAHFHNNNELDLRLTKKVIKQENLVHPAGSKSHPNRSGNSPWIELRFRRANEVREVVRLVKLAIKQI